MLKFISTTSKYLDWKYIACLYIWKIDICISKNLFPILPILIFYYFRHTSSHHKIEAHDTQMRKKYYQMRKKYYQMRKKYYQFF